MCLASPALPVGGFSYSDGLEAAVEAGRVTTEAQTATWLLDQLHLGLARSELAVASQAFKAWQRGDLNAITELNAWITTTRETSEMRLQTEQMGRSLVEWMKNRHAAAERPASLLFLAALKPAPVGWSSKPTGSHCGRRCG